MGSPSHFSYSSPPSNHLLHSLERSALASYIKKLKIYIVLLSVHQYSMAFEVSDEVLSTYVPVAVYWIFSGIYGLLGYLEGCRLHPKGAEEEENVASKLQVLRGVLLQQVVQIAVVTLMMKVVGDDGVAPQQPSFSSVCMPVLDSHGGS
ncbi:hypothetical protein J5N97_005007 [Dioscorea zingiberensis]|uniref:Uncharacterized protein n=1 Tax=Dioscorea zingiberensis TaxID=325984 RepID=A0A9D5D7S1_9LILI|nr:hypothetical protein J5N97_005007 [Dioscorea zingiberensis]